ncbi:MAG TPA: hypothetical protein VEU07_08845 [Candidatus Acidoferrum sp.]|nr:hypothetical protein [Candidatus Acidoferrum sp.]
MNPPQTPTPTDRERDDAQSLLDHRGPDGGRILDRIIRQAPDLLKPQGRPTTGVRLVLFGQKE